MSSNQKSVGEKASELYQGAKDSAAQAVDQTKAAGNDAGERVHQAGKEGRDHTHAREHAHQGSNRAQDAAGATKDHIHAGADKAAQSTKDTASKTADGSKSTIETVKEKIGLA